MLEGDKLLCSCVSFSNQLKFTRVNGLNKNSHVLLSHKSATDKIQLHRQFLHRGKSQTWMFAALSVEQKLVSHVRLCSAEMYQSRRVSDDEGSEYRESMEVSISTHTQTCSKTEP